MLGNEKGKFSDPFGMALPGISAFISQPIGVASTQRGSWRRRPVDGTLRGTTPAYDTETNKGG